MDILLKIGIALAIGIIGGKLAKLAKLPSVSGYLIAGLFVGPSLFGIIGLDKLILMNKTELESLTFISEIALAFIAFSIGSEFIISDMKQYGKKVFIIALLEVLGAVLLVFTAMFLIFKNNIFNLGHADDAFAISIVIASMSAATAPAATLLVMKQYRAYGPTTKTLLSVVALDDVIGIIVFGISMALAKMSVGSVGNESISFGKAILAPVIEIFGSILVGFIIGLILAFIAKREKDRDDMQVLTLISVIIGVGVAKAFNLSPLLTNIAIGMTIVNVLKRPAKVFNSINDFAAPFYVLFFTLAGAMLELEVLATVGMIGVIYIFCRGIGKYLGAWIGGKVSKAERTVTNFLGLGLLPQGGISIGLSVLVRQQLPQYAGIITTIIMFSVLVYETTGPIFSKLAISLSGEVNGLDKIGTDQQPELQLKTE